MIAQHISTVTMVTRCATHAGFSSNRCV